MTSCIYILKLENECFYVGRTTDLVHRFNAHKAGTGAAWTKSHKPIGIIELQDDAPYKELTTTLEYMSKYGISKVRGGPWCTVSLISKEIDTIEYLMKSESFARSERQEISNKRARYETDHIKDHTKHEFISKLPDVHVAHPAADVSIPVLFQEHEDLSRQGQFWEKDEITQLNNELKQGLDIDAISKLHKRSRAAIRARIGHLVRGLQAKGLSELEIGKILQLTKDNMHLVERANAETVKESKDIAANIKIAENTIQFVEM